MRRFVLIVQGAVGSLAMADGLTSPLAVVPASDGSERRFVVDEVGVIRATEAGYGAQPEVSAVSSIIVGRVRRA